jgi:ATP-dependent RNA helicase DHX8/PRP22
MGDILCFLTGREEIESMEKLLEEKIKSFAAEVPDVRRFLTFISQTYSFLSNNNILLQLLVCPIFAALPPDQQLKVFDPPPKNTRKVILATNIAETSITIKGIKYVVDTGAVKARSFDAKIGKYSNVKHTKITY